MKKLVAITLIFVACVLLSACASKQSDFYILKATPHTSRSYNSLRCMNIAIGPVRTAKYLDRKSIVISGPGNQVELSEFHRWAEPLDDNVERVLSENLLNSTQACNIVRYPWRGNTQYRYQVKIVINRFDTSKHGRSVLDAHWMIIGRKGKTLINQSSLLTTYISCPENYLAITAAMNRNLTRLSKIIARNINRLGN